MMRNAIRTFTKTFMNAASVSPNSSNCHANISSAGNCIKTYSEMHVKKGRHDGP